jgi:6-phosphogluconolactonase (cycloisomerase 2 family)
VAPQSIAIDATGKFAYVANEFGCADAVNGRVSIYTIDATTGALTPVEPALDSNDEGSRSVAVDASGKLAYVANWGEGDTAGSISAYSIDATSGALTSTAMIYGFCPGLCAPWSVAVHPSGKFVYVADEGSFAPTGISMYSVSVATGALTSTGTVAAGGRAIWMAIHPTGKFAYVANSSNSSPGEGNSISMFLVDTNTGALTSIGTIAAGSNPTSIGIDPLGKFAYVTNSDSSNVSMFMIDATSGTLKSIGLVTAGIAPVAVAVDPRDKFAYVANSQSNDVCGYTIDPTSGALVLIGTVAAGTTPSSIAIHPSGKFAYVTNSGSNDISIYSIDAANGALTLIATIGT